MDQDEWLARVRNAIDQITDEMIVLLGTFATVWIEDELADKYTKIERIALSRDITANQNKHKIIAAGDLNLLFGYGESKSLHWKKRYGTVFDRMSALGFQFMGPQAPDGGQQANPWPEELPIDSRNVPTFRTNKHNPETASRQLDYVFASNSLADRISVRAANSVEEWSPSDHCRLIIELEI